MMWRRLLCAMLCVLLLPVGALAEGGLRFSAGFSAEPAAHDGLMAGIADLLNVLTVEGSFEGSFTDKGDHAGFTLGLDLTLENSERARLPLSVYGYEDAIHLRTPLVGDVDMYLNMPAFIEFGVKMSNHMGLPVNKLALLYPYVWRNAFKNMRQKWEPVLFASGKSRTVSQKALVQLAKDLAASCYDDNFFYYWVLTIGETSGMDELLLGLIDQLPTWASEKVPKGGLTVKVKGPQQTWKLGNQVIAQIDEHTLHVSLSGLPDDASVLLDWSADAGDLALTLDLAQAGETLLHVAASAAGLPEALPISRPFTAEVTASGLLLDDQEFCLLLSGEGQDDQFAITGSLTGLMDKLSIFGTLSAYTPETLPSYSHSEIVLTGQNIFSLNDVSLTEFVKAIARPLVTGAIPIIAHLPVSTCVAAMDIFEQAGVFDLVVSPVSVYDDEYGDDGEGEYDADYEDYDDWDE